MAVLKPRSTWGVCRLSAAVAGVEMQPCGKPVGGGTNSFAHGIQRSLGHAKRRWASEDKEEENRRALTWTEFLGNLRSKINVIIGADRPPS